MSAPRLQQLEDLFEHGLGLDAEQRETWLAGLPIDAELRAELAGMLSADARSAVLTRRIEAAVASAASAATPGQRLGPYRLLRELGSGGAGVVFEAERADDQFRQRVAIKVIRAIAGADAARQLRHERQILAELEHPNVARLLDGGETVDGHPYLVMEFVRGEPITEACRQRAIGVRERLVLVRDLALAVHHAHQRLIIHRDLKPGNVLLREDGRPVLLDFGIAKLLSGDGASALATQPWFTPAYASPEQRLGLSVSTATDVYSLGLLLCELLSDKLPSIDGDGNVAAPSRSAPTERARGIRGDLDCIVARACAPEPSRRYPSAEALARDIDRHLTGQPVRAAPDSLGYRLGKFVRRHPVAVTASMIVALALALLTWRLYDERERALRAESAAIDQSRAAQAVTDFLVDLFSEADPNNAQGRALTPVALIDRGRERMERNVDLPLHLRARLAGALGKIYTLLGEAGKASTVLRTAVTDARRAGADPAELGADLSALGVALGDRGQDTESAAVYAEALELARTRGDGAGVIDNLSALGAAQTRMGRLSEAEATLTEAIALANAHYGADAVPTAKAQSYLAETLAFAGRHDEARPLMSRAIDTFRRRLPPDDYQLLRALSRYGVLLLNRGDTAAAEQVLLELLSKRSRLLERDSNMLANAHAGLGAVYYNQGRTLDADEHLRAALDIGTRALVEDDPTLAQYRNSFAVLALERGDYANAERPMRDALAAMERDPAQNALSIVKYRQNLGRLLTLAGKRDEARIYLEMPVGEGEDTGWALNRGLQRLSLADWHRRYGDVAIADRLLDEAQANVADIGGEKSVRYAGLVRTRALLRARGNDFANAAALLQRAHEIMLQARGPAFVGCGEVALDLAELALRDGRTSDARQWAQEARIVLDPVLVAEAPQRARLAAILAKLDAKPVGAA